MARAEIPFVVTKAQATVSGGVADYAVAGASVLVNIRGGGPATVYAGETGATTIPNPGLVTDAQGRIEGWLEEGSYDLVISGSGITTYTQPIEVLRGDGTSKLATNAVGTVHIQSAAITAAKLGTDVPNFLIPSGTIWAFAGSVLPSGWLWCDGKTYDGTNATYLSLWNAVGTTYGGTGQLSFAVPDLRGRIPVGADALGTNGAANRLTANAARGNSGGSEKHVLSINELPSHSHTGSTGSAGTHSHGGATGSMNRNNPHTHGFGGNMPRTPGSWSSINLNPPAGFAYFMYTLNQPDNAGLTLFTDINHEHGISSDGSHTHSVTINNTGSDQGHYNMQPFQVVNYIVKL